MLAARTSTAAGRTIRFGMMWCSTSVPETATSAMQKKAATNAEPVTPNFQKQPATSSAVTSSTAG